MPYPGKQATISIEEDSNVSNFYTASECGVNTYLLFLSCVSLTTLAITMSLNMLRVSAARQSARMSRTLPQTTRRMARSYATQHQQHQPTSSTPWFLGSLIVFGPILFKLTSPPPKPKKKLVEEEHHAPTTTSTTTTPPVEEAPKVQKPYVLIGAGTASFAAAQAIKEKDPQANVSIHQGYI